MTEMLNTIKVKKGFFNIRDTLECGQIFRYFQKDNGFVVISEDKICFAYEEGEETIIETTHPEYFRHFFDLERDYEKIYREAIVEDNVFLINSAKSGKGIHILNQNSYEMLFEFVISQNNNIPRIKKIISTLCERYGEKIHSNICDFYRFPSLETLKGISVEEYMGMGFGYRGEYFNAISNSYKREEEIEEMASLDEEALFSKLISLKGIGPKVANCILLFGYHKTRSFPIDTWMMKIYQQDFGGELKDNKKISQWFIDKFGDNSGYFQQYMFYYKRQKERELIEGIK